MLTQSTATEIATLRNQLAEAQETIRAMIEDRDTSIRNLMLAGRRLTIGMARMLWAMSHGGILSRDRLATLCQHVDGADPRLVDSQIKRIRKRTPQYTIRSVYGLGYQLEQDGIDLVRKRMGVKNGR